jgi:hypothetical protein
MSNNNSHKDTQRNTKGMASPTYYCSRNTQMPEENSWNENKVLQLSKTKGNFLLNKSLVNLFVYLCVTLWLKKIRRLLCLKTI